MIPYGRQSIDEDDIEAVCKALRGDFLTTGPYIEKFENALCAATDARYAVACSNGTTALHLAAMAIDLQSDDTVIIPSVTFLASANAARYCGANVIFSDVDPNTGLMKVEHLQEALKHCNQPPKAVIPVHLAGQCADLEAISELCAERNIKIIADACHAIGGEVNEKPVGAGIYEDMSSFSFHPVKTIAMGEGGAITTNNKQYADRMRRLRHHGMKPVPNQGPWCYEMSELGYNYRVSDIQCALGVSQLSKLKKFVKRRRELVALYDKALKEVDGISAPSRAENCNPAWHLYAVRIDFKAVGVSRGKLMNALKEREIGTQVHYIPVHSQPYYKDLYGELDLPGAKAYYNKTLSLPLYPAMEDQDVLYIVEQIKQIIGES